MDITKYAFVQVENQKYENIDLSLDNKYFSNLRIHQLRVSAGRSVSLIALTSNPLPAGLWSSDSSFVVWLATDLFDAWSGKSPDSLESCRFQRRRVVGELECYSEAAFVATLKGPLKEPHVHEAFPTHLMSACSVLCGSSRFK